MLQKKSAQPSQPRGLRSCLMAVVLLQLLSFRSWMHKAGVTQSAIYLKGRCCLANTRALRRNKRKGHGSPPVSLGAEGGTTLWDNGKPFSRDGLVQRARWPGECRMVKSPLDRRENNAAGGAGAPDPSRGVRFASLKSRSHRETLTALAAGRRALVSSRVSWAPTPALQPAQARDLIARPPVSPLSLQSLPIQTSPYSCSLIQGRHSFW